MSSTVLPRAATRILLRRLQASDLADFQAYRCDPAVALYQGWKTTSDAEALAFLNDVNKADLFPLGAWCQIAIAQRSDDRLIGDIGIFLSADGDEAEIGVSLSRQSQGNGLAREAVGEAIKLVFDHTNAHRVIGITDARNLPSIRLLQRLGMTKVEELETVFEGEPCTEYVFALSRDAAGL